MTSTTLMMIKPDGARMPGFPEALRCRLAEANLAVEFETAIRLSGDDVGMLYPQVLRSPCPVTQYMLSRYLRSGCVRILIISGGNAVARCRSIRTELRQRFGGYGYANRLHSADGGEVAHQLRWAARATGAPVRAGRSPHVARSQNTVPGLFGRAAQLSETELLAAAESTWVRCADADRIPPPPELRGTGRCTVDVTLALSDGMSLEWAGSALLETGCAATLEAGLMLVMQADRHGRAEVHRSTPQHAAGIRDQLAGYRILAQLRTVRPALPAGPRQ